MRSTAPNTQRKRRDSMFDDLREFISRVQEMDECKAVEGADRNSEIGAITEIESTRTNPCLLLFDKTKGFQTGFRVASNLFTSEKRVALALGLPPDKKGVELVKAMRDKLRESNKLLPPMEVETGPIKENIVTGKDVDLLKFPAPKWHELDGGYYIGTGTMTITRDPDDGWVNLGCYRIQVCDKNTVVSYIEPGHHGGIIREKYWKRGLACPVAIVCGQEPALWFAACSAVPWGVSEYEVAGSWRNKGVQVTKGVTTDLPIPATAEIVLEGEILPPDIETRLEGPFGEFPGYYVSQARQEPAIRIKSILHRNDPIIQGDPPMLWPAAYRFQQMYWSAMVWDNLDRQVPGVKGVWGMGEASLRAMLVISLKQEYAGHAKQAALTAAGSHAGSFFLRYVIVVDEDVDPSNMAEVMWALGTRCDPTSIDIVRECWSSTINPTLTPEQRSRNELGHSMAMILACRPYNWIKDFPPSVKSSPETLKKTKEKWAKLFPEVKKSS